MAALQRRPPAEASAPPVALVLKAVSAFLDLRLAPGARLCLALSGGRDSVVLLDVFKRLRAAEETFELSAIHVHHGLSADADRWAAFCTQLCQQSAVPLRVVRVDVPRGSREGPEAAARRLRLAAFAGCSADWLALAHHREDQAETVLFRLLRGAGVHGGAGMPAERALSGGIRLIRPLLAVPGAAVADYAQCCALTWIDDDSNADCRYRRNHLRHQVMPRLAEHFPGAAASLARAGRHFAEAAQLLDQLAATDRTLVAGAGGRIELGRLRELSAARARNLLRFEWAVQGFRAPDARWLDEAWRQLCAADSGAAVCLATPDGQLRVYRGALYLLPLRSHDIDDELAWRGDSALPWGGGRVSFRPTIGEGISSRLFLQEPVSLRQRQGGERFQPDHRRPRRPLRKLLQEAAVPPWERDRLPLLWCGARLAWVGGIGVDSACTCSPGEEGMLVVWEADGGSLPRAQWPPADG